ncbi:ABC transporter ATP-binding protein [uncultured Aquabacterium sp.]|uniref:ABC transporter ATP-binding protein n=1 Tax=uncultured Aquabacterium sp. TaxID=158753 RepID=UPI00261259A4|nr:ABC transporter ATP-binding protein [uncultured Aquabacterium sp.]
MTPVLQARLERVQLGRVPVLHEVDVALHAGRWIAVVGPNGAGKSTLLRALAGLVPVTGEVMLHGRPLSAWPAAERARRLAWLGQAESGGEDLRAQDVVMLGRLPYQAWLAAPDAADHLAVQAAMQQTQCWAWRARRMGELSGGERQRVLLARALAVRAPVLLMDEPLAHLDPPHQADWLDTVQALRGQGVTVVSVLHELNMALQADELIVMADGRVRHHGAACSPDAQQSLCAVFDQRVRLVQVDGHWVALPVSGRHQGS